MASYWFHLRRAAFSLLLLMLAVLNAVAGAWCFSFAPRWVSVVLTLSCVAVTFLLCISFLASVSAWHKAHQAKWLRLDGPLSTYAEHEVRKLIAEALAAKAGKS